MNNASPPTVHKTTAPERAHVDMRNHLKESDPDFVYLSADEQEERIAEQLAFDNEIARGLFVP